MPELTVEQRVANGMAWLDVNKPGWERRINLTTFDLTDPCLCVLGQVFGNYWGSPPVRVLEDLDDAGELALADHADAAARGFVNHPSHIDPYVDMQALEAEWRRVIQARPTRREAATHG